MPMRSEAQRRLMYEAASHNGGVGGVSQSVAKEFVASDKPGNLPETKDKPMAKSKWIKKATEGAHGQFRKKAQKAGESTAEFAKDHENDSGKTGKQARLAETLMGIGKKRASLYDHPSSAKKD